ncbi:hypothetical protein [Granulicella mallensis]|uniref:Uncharacterized protein n=1 Tax=Granulicella mallensis TaxID=940614 RepID=A0A7W7ZPQ8_9BACT|nr:hypothetical protein [Granulicella mallensis]MBB5063909.1 hypothetical protein [Granulicella mallensis]
MSKTLRIVAKDIRHLWPEVLLTLALTAGFAATEHFGWQVGQSSGLRESQILSAWMNALMPLSWWLLVARAVHDESLVGDRQFWITRPYSWQRVLGAKIIFLATFILLPFLLAQCFILHQAGLHPLVVFPGLLLKLVLLFAFVLLPLLALSTVTPSLTRMLLIFLAVIIYALLAIYLTSAFGPTAPLWVPMGDRQIWAAFIFLIPVIAVAVTLLQYARRRTPISNWLLIGLIGLLTFACIGSVYVKRKVVVSFPPSASGEAPPLRMEFNPDPAYQLAAISSLPKRGVESVTLLVPIKVLGIAHSHAIDVVGKSITYEDAGGVHGTTTWYQDSRDPLVGDAQIREEIYLPQDIYRETEGKSITLHLAYAVTELEAEPMSFTTPFNEAQMDVPQNGHCFKTELFGEVNCQYAIKKPQLTRITWHLHPTCDASSSADRADEKWIGGEEASETGFSPIVSVNNILNADPLGRKTDDGEVCPGEPLTFTRYRFVRRRLVEITLPPIDPQHYLLPPRT